jgi:hypothetical protein
MKDSAIDMANLNRTFNHKTVLATGANRGIGRELVDEALRPGAQPVYAARRIWFITASLLSGICGKPAT